MTDITDTYDGEFERRIPTPIVNDDPGDETDNPTSRSYRATYRTFGRRPWGGSILFRDFICCDDFLHAVEQAEDAREDGEQLLNVRDMSNGSPLTLAHR